MELRRVLRERAESGPKSKTSRFAPGRNFLQEQVYHILQYCQERFCKNAKFFVSLLFSATLVGAEAALGLNDEEAKRLHLSLPQIQDYCPPRCSLLCRNFSYAPSPQQVINNFIQDFGCK